MRSAKQQNHTQRFSLTLKRLAVFGGLAVLLTGCVAESPGYYRGYPGNDYVTYPDGTVVIHHNDREQYYYDDHNYDNHWDYGRRGNGNFHGTGDDDVHEAN